MFIETPEKQTSVTIVITENGQTDRQTNKHNACCICKQCIYIVIIITIIIKKTFVFFVCKFQAFMLSLLVKHPLHSTAHNIWSQLQKYELFCSYLFLGIKITTVQKELGLH